MLCDECQKNLATVHLTKIVDDNITKAHLCEDCAQKTSNEAELSSPTGFFTSLPQMLAGILSAAEHSFKLPVSIESIKCPTCGSSFNDLKETGRFGCDKCYVAFSDRLEPLLRRIHGNSEHRGKVPKGTAKDVKARVELRNLKKKLGELVENEAFEEAATVRDKIKNIENILQGSASKV